MPTEPESVTDENPRPEHSLDGAPWRAKGAITPGKPPTNYQLLATNYLNSSITCSSTALPGRTTDSGSVAKGASVTFSWSMNVGAVGFT